MTETYNYVAVDLSLWRPRTYVLTTLGVYVEQIIASWFYYICVLASRKYVFIKWPCACNRCNEQKDKQTIDKHICIGYTSLSNHWRIHQRTHILHTYRYIYFYIYIYTWIILIFFWWNLQYLIVRLNMKFVLCNSPVNCALTTLISRIMVWSIQRIEFHSMVYTDVIQYFLWIYMKFKSWSWSNVRMGLESNNQKRSWRRNVKKCCQGMKECFNISL